MSDDRVVHIIDDEGPVRRSLERLLQAADFTTYCYPSPASVLDVAFTLTKGCLLLDIRMPGMDGLELYGRLYALGIRRPAIVMTAQGDIETAVRAMKLGAIDFVKKPFDHEHLINLIESTLTQVSHAENQLEWADAARRVASLTARERQVLDALVVGHSTKEIAFNLGISIRTVEIHRARMLERLGVRRLAQAVRLSVLASVA